MQKCCKSVENNNRLRHCWFNTLIRTDNRCIVVALMLGFNDGLWCLPLNLLWEFYEAIRRLKSGLHFFLCDILVGTNEVCRTFEKWDEKKKKTTTKPIKMSIASHFIGPISRCCARAHPPHQYKSTWKMKLRKSVTISGRSGVVTIKLHVSSRDGPLLNLEISV